MPLAEGVALEAGLPAASKGAQAHEVTITELRQLPSNFNVFDRDQHHEVFTPASRLIRGRTVENT